MSARIFVQRRPRHRCSDQISADAQRSRSILSSPPPCGGKSRRRCTHEIVTAMARKDRVELCGFGAFSVKDKAGRIGRNPKSGVKVEVPEKSVPVFRPSKEIGRRLNPVVSIPESSERLSRRSRQGALSGNPLFPWGEW